MRPLVILLFFGLVTACVSGTNFLTDRDSFANAEQVWSQYESSNFTLLTDVSEARAGAFLTELEDFRSFARQTLGTVSGIRPHLIVIAPSTRTGFSVFADPNRVGGKYFRTIDTDFMIINLSLTQETSRGLNGVFTAEEILRHEYMHAVIADLPGKPVPTWLNEGFAEYFSTAQRQGDGFIVGQPLPDRLNDLLTFKSKSDRLRLGVRRSPASRVRTVNFNSSALVLAPLETIVDANFASQVYRDTRDRTNFHAQAWLLVHRLYSTPDGREKLATYLDQRARAGSEAETLHDVLGEDLDEYDDFLWDLVRGRDFPTQYLPALPKREIVVRRVGPVSEADLWCNAGRFKGGTENAKTAKSFFRRALKADPENICALSHLSKLESADGNFEIAEALTARAEAQNGNDAFTPLSRAMLSYYRFTQDLKAGNFNTVDLQQGIASAEQAIEAGPTIPLSYIVHASLLEQMPEADAVHLCAGLQSMLMAEQLLPQGSPFLKGGTARFYARLGHLEQAREKLAFYEAWTLDELRGLQAKEQLELVERQLELKTVFLETGLSVPEEYPVTLCDTERSDAR